MSLKLPICFFYLFSPRIKPIKTAKTLDANAFIYSASPTPSLLPLYTPPPSLSSSPSIFEKGNRVSSFLFSFPPSHSSPTNRPRGTDPFSFPGSLPAGSPSFPHTSLPASSSSSQLYSHSRLPLVFSFPLGETAWICTEQQQYHDGSPQETTKPAAKEKHAKRGSNNNGSHGKRKIGSKSFGLKGWKLELGVVSEEAEAEPDVVDVEANARGPVETKRVLEV